MAINNYLDNITSQHRDKPKFISWLSSNLTIIDHLYLTAKSIDLNFDLDNAIGNQLDVLGTIIGRERTLTFEPLNNYSPVLNDETYRLILKAKVAINNWDGTIPQMYELWDNIFSDLKLQIKDNQDMSFTAFIEGYVDQIKQELIQKGYIVPKPEGVRVNYVSRSSIKFKPHSAMLVSCIQTSIVNMEYDPVEVINLHHFSHMMIQGITTTTLNVGAKGGN